MTRRERCWKLWQALFYGLVGVECDGLEIYMVLDQCNARSPKSCRRCGAKLRLHYEVWIEEEA